ncbi:hypothetical protein ACFPU1_13250 [Thalassorhabdus alkalitolerans]|uniref:ClpX C4-type zinc finger n=1 Tax=Thalassorhabdus alkalitolerans TaxID=2282697 RepID=A0ABW0YPQ6_9BACI|nr:MULTISPECIES: hypothetical protein [Bacillaceae]
MPRVCEICGRREEERMEEAADHELLDVCHSCAKDFQQPHPVSDS